MKCPRREENIGLVAHLTATGKLAADDAWREDRTCTYCGSLNPDDFMAAVEAGTEIEPTDKGYKAYVGKTQKFYYQHLSVEQRQRFVVLLNEHKINIGYPGRFYVLPFFIRR